MGVKRKDASDQLERKVTEILAPKGITVDAADFLGHYANEQISQRIIQRVNSANPDAVSWALDLSGGIQRVAIEHGCSLYDLPDLVRSLPKGKVTIVEPLNLKALTGATGK